MLHPIFSLLVKRPDLLMRHLSSYIGLVSYQTQQYKAQWIRKMIGVATALLGAFSFVVLSGTAAMMYAISGVQHWALLGVPLMALLTMLIGIGVARSGAGFEVLDQVKEQLAADGALLESMAMPAR